MPPTAISNKIAAASAITSRRRFRSSCTCASACAAQLGLPQPLLDAGQVRRHPLGDDPSVARTVEVRWRQAIADQGDQLGLGAAAVKPGERLVQLAARCLAHGLAQDPADERGMAGEDLAEDGPQAEDVCSFIHGFDLAPRCSGAM